MARILIVVALLIVNVSDVTAQHAMRRGPGMWVGAPSEEYTRLLQLTGVMPLSSLMIRPTDAPLNWQPPDTARWRAPWAGRYKNAVNDSTPLVSIYLFNPYTQATFNSAFPYGMNDGVMWAGKGLSFAQTIGARIVFGPATLDVAPTYTWSQNLKFQLGDQYIAAPQNTSKYADIYSGLGIDRPQRFGEVAVSRFDAGQSALTVGFRGARIGVAQRNMWFGPATLNSLLMTNNGPGIPHAFVGTQRPISVRIGHLEALWTVGTLTQSGFWRILPDTFATDRWLNALSVVFEPKGASGMYFGATRVFYAYQRYNPITLREIATMFQTFDKSRLVDSANPFGDDYRDQMLSLSYRWVFPPAGFEMYGEWGRNDHNMFLRDLAAQLDHSRAFSFGAAKAFRLGTGALSLRVEAIDLANTLTFLSRATPVWYQHHLIQQGYTERGQIIGAGVGPGSNQQSLTVDWFMPQRRLGFVVQRHRENIDGFYRAGFLDPYRNDASLLVGARATLFVGAVELDALYMLQYEFNRYAIASNDQRNHRVELRGQAWLP